MAPVGSQHTFHIRASDIIAFCGMDRNVKMFRICKKIYSILHTLLNYSKQIILRVCRHTEKKLYFFYTGVNCETNPTRVMICIQFLFLLRQEGVVTYTSKQIILSAFILRTKFVSGFNFQTGVCPITRQNMPSLLKHHNNSLNELILYKVL